MVTYGIIHAFHCIARMYSPEYVTVCEPEATCACTQAVNAVNASECIECSECMCVYVVNVCDKCVVNSM